MADPAKHRRRSQKWRENNRERSRATNKKYKQEHPEKNRESSKRWAQKNPEKISTMHRRYVKTHSQEINASKREKYHSDPIIRNRKLASNMAYAILTENGGSKKGQSFLKKIDWTPKQLWDHLVSLFEPWMTQDNQGPYNKDKWNDNDSTTWAWQLDHIIPQSDLPYDNMDHPNFKKSWDLSNLRPLNAKQNILDGARKIRHKKKSKHKKI